MLVPELNRDAFLVTLVTGCAFTGLKVLDDNIGYESAAYIAISLAAVLFILMPLLLCRVLAVLVRRKYGPDFNRDNDHNLGGVTARTDPPDPVLSGSCVATPPESTKS